MSGHWQMHLPWARSGGKAARVIAAAQSKIIGFISLIVFNVFIINHNKRALRGGDVRESLLFE